MSNCDFIRYYFCAACKSISELVDNYPGECPHCNHDSMLQLDKLKVLDHGFVQLRNISGPIRRMNSDFDASSEDPAISARISFNDESGFKTNADNMRLNRYLIKNRHNTPLEMIEIWLEMKMPIFVARQFVRHRTATINEVSARYVQLPKEWYIPQIVGGKPENAKQGQSDVLHPSVQEQFRNNLNAQCTKNYELYESYLASNVAPEHARMFLHVNHYTRWLWKQDLHNMMHFLTLRADSHAQLEAQAYARAIIYLLKERLPELMHIYEAVRNE